MVAGDGERGSKCMILNLNASEVTNLFNIVLGRASLEGVLAHGVF